MNRRKCLLALGFAIFVLLIQPLASAGGSTNTVVYRIRKTYQIPNNSSVTAENVVATPLRIFDNRGDWANQQVLSENIQLSDGTYEIIRTDDNRVVRASLGTMSGGELRTIEITQVVKVEYVNPEITSGMVQGSIPDGELQYAQPVANLWESDDSAIDNKAHELTDNYPNYYDKAKQIYDFVQDYLTYVEYGPEHSALWAYTYRTGDCSEYTHLFIALARAAGIPARHVEGYGYQAQYGTSLDNMGHAWAFIYLPSVGWVPIDTRWGTPEWNFCLSSADHLVRTTSDGQDLVKDNQIKMPGECTEPSYTYYGDTSPGLTVERTATITREVAAEVSLDASSQLQGGNWTWSVTVKNLGTQAIENIQVQLQVDQTYFEAPAAQTIDTLAADSDQTVNFNVGVKDATLKQGVENSTVTALVTYDSLYGSFGAEGTRPASVSPQVVPAGEIIIGTEMINLLLIAVIAVIIISAVAVAVVRLRR